MQVREASSVDVCGAGDEAYVRVRVLTDLPAGSQGVYVQPIGSNVRFVVNMTALVVADS